MGRSSTVAGLLAPLLALAAGCTGSGPPDPAPQAVPPAPPAACLLDPATLAATSGVTWTPDQSIATDTRCVYDAAPAAPGTAEPGTAAPDTAAPGTAEPDREAPGTADRPVPADGPPGFLAVEIASTRGADPAAELDTIAQVCAPGSRAPVTAAEGGFVCRIAGAGVYGAVVRGGQVITLSASTVPAGTSAARLVVAVSQQLAALRPG